MTGRQATSSLIFAPKSAVADPPPRSAFTPAERRLIDRLRTPARVQTFLNALPYNTEPPPEPATLRSFRGVVRRRTANCLEAAITAATILEQHGYPPLVLSLESIDGLDHVVFIYRGPRGWGSVARSRDPGLHGRQPVFRSLRTLALSYFDPFVDFTGRIRGYGAADLRALGRYDWRLAERNVWRVERLLFEIPHRPVRSSDARVDRLRARYFRYRREHEGEKPGRGFYEDGTWTRIPSDR